MPVVSTGGGQTIVTPGKQSPVEVTAPEGQRGLQGPAGPAGPPGAAGAPGLPGTSITYIATVPHLGDLPTTLTVADKGKAYVVNDSGHMYVWQGASWQDVGQMRGPQGPQGIPGQWTSLTAVQYAALNPPDPNTLYLVIG